MAFPGEVLTKALDAIASAFKVKVVDTTGTEKFTDANPGKVEGSVEISNTPTVQLSGSSIRETQALPVKNVFTSKTPMPPVVVPEIIDLNPWGILYVGWMDKDGVLWGLNYQYKIYKSIDYGTSWTAVIDVASFLNESESIQLNTLIVSDTGRIIIGTTKSRVLVSDELQTTFTEAFTFLAGKAVLEWGYFKYENIILMTPYGAVDSTGINPPRELYASFDHGESWTKIFEMEISNMIDPTKFHIHTTMYDPWSKGIFIVTGDFINRQVYVSYDLGENWKPILSVPTDGSYPIMHPTDMLPFSHGIIFGSDELPEGIRYWPRPIINSINPEIKESDIIADYLHWSLPDDIMPPGYAVHGWRTYNKELTVAVMPFRVDISSLNKNGYSRLLATPDGRQWFEIFRETSHTIKGFYNILGPHPGDIDRHIIGTYSMPDKTYMFRAKLPEFV